LSVASEGCRAEVARLGLVGGYPIGV